MTEDKVAITALNCVSHVYLTTIAFKSLVEIADRGSWYWHGHVRDQLLVSFDSFVSHI